MNISCIKSVLTTTLSCFGEKVVEAASGLNKRIGLVALIAISCIAALFLIKWYVQKSNSLSQDNNQTNVSADRVEKKDVVPSPTKEGTLIEGDTGSVEVLKNAQITPEETSKVVPEELSDKEKILEVKKDDPQLEPVSSSIGSVTDTHDLVTKTKEEMGYGTEKRTFIEARFNSIEDADEMVNSFYNLYQTKEKIAIGDIETADIVVEMYTKTHDKPENSSQMEKIRFMSAHRDEALEQAVQNAKTNGQRMVSDSSLAAEAVKDGHYEERGRRGQLKVCYYTGHCVGGKPNGDGFMVYPTSDGYYTYSGHFVDGEQIGKGVGIHANGRRYAGEFYKTKRHGQGVFTAEPGGYVNMEPQKMVIAYSGSYQNGFSNGEGTATFFDETAWKGTFAKNKPVGKGIFIDHMGVEHPDTPWEDVLAKLQIARKTG